MPSPTKVSTPAPSAPAEPFVAPEGIRIEHKIGPVTGNHMYKVAGFEMPYESSPEAAVKLYARLKHAYESGYFISNGNRK